jgi:hypothetical protein
MRRGAYKGARVLEREEGTGGWVGLGGREGDREGGQQF